MSTLDKLKISPMKDEPERFNDGVTIERNCVTVTWGGYPYDFDLRRIETPENLLGWVVQLGTKGWPKMTAQHLAAFVEKIAKVKKFDIYGI